MERVKNYQNVHLQILNEFTCDYSNDFMNIQYTRKLTSQKNSQNKSENRKGFSSVLSKYMYLCIEYLKIFPKKLSVP